MSHKKIQRRREGWSRDQGAEGRCEGPLRNSWVAPCGSCEIGEGAVGYLSLADNKTSSLLNKSSFGGLCMPPDVRVLRCTILQAHSSGIDCHLSQSRVREIVEYIHNVFRDTYVSPHCTAAFSDMQDGQRVPRVQARMRIRSACVHAYVAERFLLKRQAYL
jgi:hypothetical protein